MAEETGEVKSLDRTDPSATTAGNEQFLEKREDSYSDVDIREFDASFDEPPDTEQIKARIEETRNQMGETIDAIQERLSLASISEQVSETVSSAIETAKDAAYDATIGKAVNLMKNVGDGVSHSGAFRTVKKNPFPLALIGIGAGLLAYQSLGRTGSSRKGNGRASGGGSYSGADGRIDRSRFNSAKRTIGNATTRAYDGIADKANTAIEGVSNVAGTAYEGVTGAVSNAYSEAGELAHRAYDRVGEYGNLAHEKYDEYLEENPLALGARWALAVGAAVGFAIPSTQFEDKLMGDTREKLMQRAQDAAGSLIHRAKHVAGQTINDEARALGH